MLHNVTLPVCYADILDKFDFLTKKSRPTLTLLIAAPYEIFKSTYVASNIKCYQLA